MELNSFFSDRTTFESVESIKNFIKNSKNYDSSKESPEKSNSLLIFNTSSQQTWLIATEMRLYCILDDLRKPTLHINWSINRDQIIQNNKIIIDLNTRDKTENTGLLDIGKYHNKWLFSKKLFLRESIITMLKTMLTKSMLEKKFN